MIDRPRGVVTFLFSDIEGSTALWEQDPEAMRSALAAHDELVGSLVPEHGGVIFKHTGDGFAAVFASASDALTAACALEAALVTTASGQLRARMGIHTGEAEPRGDDYFGRTVNQAARIMDAANGGQITISGTTFAVVRGVAPPDTTLVDEGAHRLKDLQEPVRIYRLVRSEASDLRPLRTLDITANNLPTQLTSFVGRDDEVASLAAALADTRLVTLTGLGGIGKTRLALQVGADSLHRYPDGVWLLELATITDPELIPRLMAEVLNATVHPQQSSAEAVYAHLAGKNALVIFDNCEHLIADVADLVDQVLRRAPDVTALATSREGLAVLGERLWPVHPLSVTGDQAALRLFEERAELVDHQFAVTDENREVVEELCTRLDGIPLAIELATARLKALDVHQILERINDRFRLLTSGARTAAGRQRTLQATMDWSFDLLNEAERVVLARLGVFTGGFSLEAAQAVAADDATHDYEVLDTVERLVDTSLVNFDKSARRYELLETVRGYALDRLAEAGDSDGAHRRHAEYFAAWLRHRREQLEAVTYLDPPDAEAALEIGNVRAAMSWAYDTGDPELGLSIALGIHPHLAKTDADRELLRWLLPGLRHFDQPTNLEQVRGLVRAQLAAWVVAQDEQAAELTERIRSALSVVTDAEQLAELHHALGNAAFNADTAGSDREFATAIDLFRGIGSRNWTRPLNGRLLLIYQANDTSHAEEVLGQYDDAVAEGLETPLYRVTVKAEISVALDRAESAVASLEAIEVGDLSPGMRRLVRYGMASAYHATGRLDDATATLDELDKELQSLGRLQAVRINAWPSWWRALIALDRGALDDVVPLLGDFHALADRPDAAGPRVLVAAIHALLANGRADPRRAAELYGYYDHWSQETGWRLRPQQRPKLEEAVARARELLGDAEFEQLVSTGAGIAYSALPLYDA